MSLDDVDLECLLLDRLAAAKDDQRKGAEGDSVEAAIAEAMGGSQ